MDHLTISRNGVIQYVGDKQFRAPIALGACHVPRAVNQRAREGFQTVQHNQAAGLSCARGAIRRWQAADDDPAAGQHCQRSR